jgi:tetratricopeptide (TPR) repeat protein
LAKGAAVTLPVVLLACAWWQRGRIERRDLLRVVPFLLIGAAMTGIELWTQHNVAQREVVRTDGLLSRAGVAGCAVWFYLGELMWPVGLCPIYPRWMLNNRSIFWYMPSLISAALLAWAWWKRRSWGRPVVMSIVCYVAFLLPILGFANIYFMRFSLVADHWQYIATIVPCGLFAAGCSTLARRFVPRPAAIGAAVGLLSVLAGLSFRQSGTYRDSEAFYETTIACNPACWLAYNNLGTAVLNRGDYASAIADYRKSLELNPSYAAAHYNLGNALLNHGQVDSAIAEYRKAIASDSNYPAAHNNLAGVLARRGDLDSAIEEYQKVLELVPQFAEAHNNLGMVLLSRGQIDSAIEHFQRALELDPNHAAARMNLAKVLAGRGEIDQAISRSQAAIADNPENAEAHFSLANALFRRGEVSSAIAHYQMALEINPSFAAAHANLATALADGDDFDSAIDQYRAALKIEPDNKLARNNLGVVVSARENMLNTVAEQRKAVRLHPDDAVALNNLARTLATNPNASIRNGGKAVELAERAVKLSGRRKPSVLNTLAAAYAEAGRFSNAVQTAEQAEQLSSAAGDRALAEQIRSRLELYRSGKPYRQPHGE